MSWWAYAFSERSILSIPGLKWTGLNRRESDVLLSLTLAATMLGEGSYAATNVRGVC